MTIIEKIKSWFKKKPLFKLRNEYGETIPVYKGETIRVVQYVNRGETTTDTTKSCPSGFVPNDNN